MNPSEQPLADIPVTDASSTQEELDAKIDAELGITSVPKVETQDEETTNETTESEEANSDSTAADDDSEVEASEEEGAEDEEPVEEAKPTEPATPSDAELFIEVEDAEGVTHKISTIEDLPEDFAPKNNRQIIEIVANLAKLDSQRELAASDAEKAAEAEVLAETQKQTFQAWDKEVAELAKTDRLDIKDTERIDAVFGLMNDINAARMKAGNPNLVSSFEDALDKFEAKETADAAELAKKNETDTAKKKASIIGRTSAAAGGDSYVYRSGSARTIDDVPL